MNCNAFDKDVVNSFVSGVSFDCEFLDCVDSTSDYIKRKLAGGESISYPFCVAALRQTAGRGRLSNRSFFSPEGGLYFSCAFTPQQIRCSKSLITVASAVAVAVAVESACGYATQLKWVNDVLIDGKKVCGILTESVYSSAVNSYVYIVGIGVNVSARALDGFMPNKVTALPRAVNLSELLGKILNNLNLCLTDSDNGFVADYDLRLSIAGRQVQITRNNKTVTATVLGVSEQGLLCESNGVKITVNSCNDIITDLYELLRDSK